MKKIFLLLVSGLTISMTTCPVDKPNPSNTPHGTQSTAIGSEGLYNAPKGWASTAIGYSAPSQEKLTPVQEPVRISSENILQHAQFWTQNLPELTIADVKTNALDESSLLANFLYFSALSTYYEAQARKLLINNYISPIILNKQLVANEAEARKTCKANAALLLKIPDEILPMRAYSMKAYAACIKEIENSEYKTLKEIIVNFQQYSQAIVVQMSMQDKENIEKTILNAHTSLNTYLDKLGSYRDIFQSILDHKNPYLKEGGNPVVTDLEVSLSLSDAILATVNEISSSAALLKLMSVDILNINTLINTTFYNVLLEAVLKSATPMPILFDENGLIASKNRNEHLELIDENFRVNKKHYLNN